VRIEKKRRRLTLTEDGVIAETRKSLVDAQLRTVAGKYILSVAAKGTDRVWAGFGENAKRNAFRGCSIAEESTKGKSSAGATGDRAGSQWDRN